MEEPNKKDVDEFIKMGENAPKTASLDKDGQQRVLDAIANAKIDDANAERKQVQIVKCVEMCPHCETELEVEIPEDHYITTCTNCGKAIVVCDKCDRTVNTDCSNCVYCDLANFCNYLKGNVTIEQFLGALNPPLADMTTSSNPMIPFTYENFVDEVGGDDVNWDIKYWSIYGKILASGLSEGSTEEDILGFVKEIIEENRK